MEVIYTFPQEENNTYKFSSIAVDTYDNIYVCENESKRVYKITPLGQMTQIYSGTVYVEGDYCNIIWNDKYGLISDEKHPKIIEPNFDIDPNIRLESALIDTSGFQYKLVGDSLWNCDTKKYTLNYHHIYDEHKGCSSDSRVKILDIVFDNNDVYTINICGTLFKNAQVLSKVWGGDRYKIKKIYIVSNFVVVNYDDGSFVGYNKHAPLKLPVSKKYSTNYHIIHPRKHDASTVTKKGDIILCIDNTIYRLKNAFPDNF